MEKERLHQTRKRTYVKRFSIDNFEEAIPAFTFKNITNSRRRKISQHQFYDSYQELQELMTYPQKPQKRETLSTEALFVDSFLDTVHQ